MKMDLDALLLQESRRSLDLAGCKSAEELLKYVLNQADEELAELKAKGRELADEELDQVIAAGGVSGGGARQLVGADHKKQRGRTAPN